MDSLRFRAGIVVSLLLLLASPLFMLSVSAQPSMGNWVITGTQVVQNESITLNGNLTVVSGGNLTLRNVKLTMNTQYNGEYGILVQPGGSIYVYGSVITAANLAIRYTFVAEGTNFVLKGSEVQGAGWCQSTTVQNCWPSDSVRAHSTLLVASNKALIQNNTISHGAIGLILTGTDDVVQGNLIQKNDFSALMLLGSSGDSITGNVLYQNRTSDVSEVILLNGAQGNTIAGNTIEEQNRQDWRSTVDFDGIAVDAGSNGNLISKNNIAVSSIGVFPLESSDTSILNNTITFGEAAVSILWVGVNTKIMGNTMIEAFSQQAFGIIVNLAHSSVIADNTLSGTFSQEAIYLDHTDNASLIDNKVSGTGTQISLFLFHSRNDQITGNSFSGAEYGLFVSGNSDGNLLTDNIVDASHSATIVDSKTNTIYGNNFYDASGPTGGPYDNGNNSWYSGQEGNYWAYSGGSEYSRTVIPPDGKEPFSLAQPVSISSHKIPVLNQLPIPPLSNSGPQSAATTIKDETVSVNSGCLCGNVTIINSTVTLGKDGIVGIDRFRGGSITIENSKILDGGYGFILGAYNIAYPLVVKNSTIQGAYMEDLDASNITLVGSTFVDSQESYGISVANAHIVTIMNSTFTDDTVGAQFYCGLSVSKSILIAGTKFSNTLEVAINSNCVSTPSFVIANNTISGSWGDGITAGGPDNAVIEGNNVSGIRGYNPISAGGNGDTIADNKVANSAYGINVGGSNSLVTANALMDDSSGGLLLGGNNDEVVGNTISNIGYWGIQVTGSANTIYHNNVVDAQTPAIDQTGLNQWSHNGEGNYWSSYAGKDPDLDGIGDTPFLTGKGGQDSFPFVKPNGWLTKFYFTMNTNLPTSTPFTINGSTFKTATIQTTIRLGYVASYVISMPQSVKLSNGSSLVFVRWGDGQNSATRTLRLGSNSTLTAMYALQAPTVTTTTSTPATTTSTSFSGSSTTTSSPASSILSTSATSSSVGGGGIPEFPYKLVTATAFATVVILSYLVLRHRVIRNRR
ncbi:MAG: right-handed parallel beta-helix repeat-containing protein [Thaumarchaeota archaeon]|nr:right-handed parallel beta-helix repeat-containing protein [Nitrososphaerota archaeon]